MVRSSGAVEIEGFVKVKSGQMKKATRREALGIAKKVGRELSFEDDASELQRFGAFLRRVRRRFDHDTLPAFAVVVAYRAFISSY